MKNLCFVSAVGGERYEQFVPLFLYSVRKAYPAANARVYLAGRPSPSIRDALEVVLDDKRNVIPFAFEGYETRGRSTAMWRYLVFTSERSRPLMSYRYIYITDIDFIICPEEPTIVEQHTRHCSVLELPYSGHIRRYVPKLVCGRFFCKRSFISRIVPAADYWDLQVRELGDDAFRYEPRHPDEHLMYKLMRGGGLKDLPTLASPLAEDEFNIMDPAQSGQALFNPHHGIHLGIGRAPIPRIVGRYGGLFRKSFYGRYLDYLLAFNDDPEFRDLRERMRGFDLVLETYSRMLEIAKDRSLRGFSGEER